MESIPLTRQGLALPDPFTGAWNSGQFWPCDMDFDGHNDLLVFDKAAGRTLVFLRKDDQGILSWRYAREFEDLLPPVQSWLATADYNCDGKLDIFTRAPAGIRFYRNASETPGQAAFVLESAGLTSEGFSGQVNIQVNAYGAPAFTDVDGDGDLDILNFDFAGNTVEYHRNRVKELSGSCAGFNLKKDSCVFGRFATKPNCGQIKLSTSCIGMKPGEKPEDDKNILHLGSQLSALDLDNDGDKDLLVGDIGCPQLYKLTNGGSSSEAFITQADTLFPSPDDFVRIQNFPSAYRLDADFDGDTDLIVTPTYFSNFSDGYVHNARQATFLYANYAPSGAPQFQFYSRDFLQKETIDAGEEAIPAFADADGDGDQDLFLGHLGNQTAGGLRASVHFYRNTGSVTSPAFELVTEDYLNLSSLGLVRIRPVWTDLNMDGSPDFGWMASKGVNPGDSSLFQFLLNQALPGQAFAFPGLESRKKLPLPFNLYDCPLFTDTDGDQLADLILGKYNGKLQLWKRTAAWPDLSFQLMNANYGNIARAPFSTGPCLALADANLDGSADLLVGDNSGALKFYSAFLSQNPDQFVADSLLFFNKLVGMELPTYGGAFVSPALADLNGDAFPELATGFAGGGLQVWVNRFGPNKTSGSLARSLKPAFPNPAKSGSVVRLGNGPGRVRIWNGSGMQTGAGNCSEDGGFLLPSPLPDGLYQLIKEENGKCSQYRIQVWN